MRWIIGDVHGMLVPLEAMLDNIRARDRSAELFFCGDYCDRGPHTRQVIDLLLSLRNAKLVRGNHDDVMDLCCNGTSFTTGAELGQSVEEAQAEIKELFLREGLTETLVSYGAELYELGRRVGDWPAVLRWIDEALALVPLSHRSFFRSLPAVVEADDFFVCHATWPPDHLDEPGRMNGIVAGDPYLRHDVLWGRYTANQVRARKVWKRVGYFGHTPTDNYLGAPDIMPESGSITRGEKTVLLDTGAFVPGGRLTAICHDDGRIIQVEQSGDVVR
jgi:serine/threonine protein phosphatase 1